MKKYTITLEPILVETVEADNMDEAQQEAVKRVNMKTGNVCNWIVTEIIEEEENKNGRKIKTIRRAARGYRIKSY